MSSRASAVGPYRLLEPIGRGGMGAVYRAEHVETGLRVALKTVLVAHATELAAIRSEINALRRLTHPGIVRILDAGVEGAVPWYAMELLEGETLHGFQRGAWSSWVDSFDDLIETAGTDAPTQQAHPSASHATRGMAVRDGAPAAAGKLPEALTLARRLCSPLAYLHELGIVHRDLKPANVFVRPDGRPVLMDFGLVSRWSAGGGRDVLEIAGTLAGTAAYMAPEQVRRERVDARSDLYALGCMLYELVAGRPPFCGHGVARTLEQQLTEAPEPPSSRVAGVPAGLDELVLRLLAKRPRDRIGHAERSAADGSTADGSAAERSAAAERHRKTAAELVAAFQRFARMIPLARPRVWLWRGTYAWRVGRRSAARRLWRRSIESARRIGLPIDEAKVHYWMGRSLAGEERARHLRIAIEHFERMRCAPEPEEARRLLGAEGRARTARV
ncbi:MAG TPA: serine/threonine-protein kinase [Thermoanaerobaculia bacterium]|nr:serine/threonine-protein kinase [Thermoanaerobaculia bacterium]